MIIRPQHEPQRIKCHTFSSFGGYFHGPKQVPRGIRGEDAGDKHEEDLYANVCSGVGRLGRMYCHSPEPWGNALRAAFCMN